MNDYRYYCVNAGNTLMQLRITNRGDNAVNVRVIDRLYYENNEDEILNEFDDTASIDVHERNTFSYYLNFSEEGDYYHRILIYAGGRLQLSFVEGLETVKNADEESCSCYLNNEGIGGCKEPTSFITIQGATGNCNPEKLFDSNGINFGTDEDFGDEFVEFYDDGRLRYKLINLFGAQDRRDYVNDGGWICNQNDGDAVLDLGREYDIYAIRIYGNPNIEFKLYYSRDGENFNQINNGNVMNLNQQPNYEERGGIVGGRYNDDGEWVGGGEDEQEYYFLFEYDINPEQNEIYSNSPVRARYIKYEVTQGFQNNLGAEIVVEGKIPEDAFDFRLRTDVNDNLMCPDDSGNVVIRLTNIDQQRRMAEGATILDKFYYDEDCNGVGTEVSQRTFQCAEIGYGASCVRNYNVDYDNEGCYYHNTFVYQDEDELARTMNAARVTVNGREAAGCCITEGRVPDENEVCCNNMPEDGPGGACGCPNDMRWEPLENNGRGACIPSFQRCGYVEERNVCTSLGYIITHPLQCLFPSREEPPYEQSCCPYIDYDNQEYYRFENVVVY